MVLLGWLPTVTVTWTAVPAVDQPNTVDAITQPQSFLFGHRNFREYSRVDIGNASRRLGEARIRRVEQDQARRSQRLGDERDDAQRLGSHVSGGARA